MKGSSATFPLNRQIVTNAERRVIRARAGHSNAPSGESRSESLQSFLSDVVSQPYRYEPSRVIAALDRAVDNGANVIAPLTVTDHVPILVSPLHALIMYSTEHGGLRMQTARLISKMIRRGANVNAVDEEGQTPLSRALKLNYSGPNRAEIVHALIERGANVNMRFRSRRMYLQFQYQYPIHIATAYVSIQRTAHERRAEMRIIHEMLRAGADVNSRDENGDTPIMRGAQYFGDMCKFLISHGADVNARDNDGQTALHHAMVSGAKELIKSGANVSAVDRQGRTPLMTVPDSTRKILLLNGADVNARDNDGKTVLIRDLSRSIRLFSVGRVRVLLDAGANVDLQDFSGMTALMYTCYADGNPLTVSGRRTSSRFPIFELLLTRTRNINAVDSSGHTALWHVVRGGLGESAVRLLLDKGANRTNRAVLAISARKGSRVRRALNAVRAHNSRP